MRRAFLLIAYSIAIGASACTVKPELTDDEERYVQITIALMKARANVAQVAANDTTRQAVMLKQSIDSVYRRFEIDSVGYHKLSISLADNPAHAVLAHQAIKDSLKIK